MAPEMRCQVNPRPWFAHHSAPHTQTQVAFSFPQCLSSGFRFSRVMHSLQQMDASQRLWPASPSACWGEDFLRLTPLTPFSSVFLPCLFLSTAKPGARRTVLVSAGLRNLILRFFFFESVNKPKQVERIC